MYCRCYLKCVYCTINIMYFVEVKRIHFSCQGKWLNVISMTAGQDVDCEQTQKRPVDSWIKGPWIGEPRARTYQPYPHGGRVNIINCTRPALLSRPSPHTVSSVWASQNLLLFILVPILSDKSSHASPATPHPESLAFFFPCHMRERGSLQK